MATDSTPSTNAGAVFCARHPDVETGLSCGRCGTPICPRCLVHTPAGARCAACAAIGRPKMYVLAPFDYVRAVAAGLVAAVAAGILGAMLLPPSGRIGLFSILFAVLGGTGAGTAIAEAMSRVTRRKRGREMQIVAGAAVVVAGVTRLAMSGVPLEYAARDIAGLFMIVIGVSVASSRLR